MDLGLTGKVVALGLLSSYCTTGKIGNIGVAPGSFTTEECAYECTLS